MVTRLIQRTCKVAPHELLATVLSFLFVLLLMCSYYILRPVRDSMASDWSDSEVSFLWTLNFFLSAAAVSIYGWIVTKVRLRWLVKGVYIFFALSFLGYFILRKASMMSHTGLDKGFYIWVSLYSLFNISVFWSFMSDVFNQEQAKRLFPVIGAGASTGALIGPLIPGIFSGWLSTQALLLIASLLLLPVPPLIIALSTLKRGRLGNKDLHGKMNEIIGGHPFAGFRRFFENRYLRNIGLFIILYTAVASIIYFQQKNLLAPFSRSERAQILSLLDWLVNLFSFSIAFFATGRILTRFGMVLTLAVIPLAMSGGLLVLAAAPILSVALALQVGRRAGNYAVTRPAREVLFTHVSQEDRFKSKPVIDIVAYRGGDMVTSWGFAMLTAGFGFGASQMAMVGAMAAGVWGLTAVKLGRQFEKTTSLN